MPGEVVVVTGIGICTPAGADGGSFAAALRRGDRVAADAGVARLNGFDLAERLRALDVPAAVEREARQAARRAPLGVQVSVCTAVEAWRQAGLFDGDTRAEEVSLIVAGQNLAQGYAHELGRKHAGDAFVPASHALHFMDTDHVGVVSEVLGIRGEGFTAGGASASGNVGLMLGLRQIATGRARVCLVVGAMMDLSPVEIQSLRNMGAMSEDGCRPFDRERCGFVYGQGGASLVLESASHAEARGARPLGRVRGGAECLDGNRSSDPRQAGEARAMRLALADAGIEPTDVEYVNTHGTGSKVGDPVEYAALEEVFGDHFPSVWLNSTKAITGHCLTAAGVVEAAAVLMQMNGRFLHPTPGLEHPIGDAGRFVPAPGVGAACRVAMSNSFGFGGINSAIVLERS